VVLVLDPADAEHLGNGYLAGCARLLLHRAQLQTVHPSRTLRLSLLLLLLLLLLPLLLLLLLLLLS
jgi:hypothetical protein